MSAGSIFYSAPPTGDQRIHINPALITITDGRYGHQPEADLQYEVHHQVMALVAHGVRTFHVDVIFPDYGAFATDGPDVNTAIFTPIWFNTLARDLIPFNAYLNVHLLTDDPLRHVGDYARAAGAVCFQLDGIADDAELASIIDTIRGAGACASPVIETQGTSSRPAAAPDVVAARLYPYLDQIGMLTLQAAATGARADQPGTVLATELVRAYLSPLRTGFNGTIQLQGGITVATIPQAVQLGGHFLVVGSQLFRNRNGYTPQQIIDAMLNAARRISA